MSLPVRLSPEAEDDFDKAFDRYDTRTSPAGPTFAVAVRAVYRRISANPRMHGRVLGDVRRALVSGYP